MDREQAAEWALDRALALHNVAVAPFVYQKDRTKDPAALVATARQLGIKKYSDAIMDVTNAVEADADVGAILAAGVRADTLLKGLR